VSGIGIPPSIFGQEPYAPSSRAGQDGHRATRPNCQNAYPSTLTWPAQSEAPRFGDTRIVANRYEIAVANERVGRIFLAAVNQKENSGL